MSPIASLGLRAVSVLGLPTMDFHTANAEPEEVTGDKITKLDSLQIMVILDKTLRKLNHKGHKVLLFSQMNASLTS
ncbi:hypothetical protein PsorP6_017532 [Peronosclerospora sorghi]|uniref:Uncharacterized protein n=1 Tax=Peronosclerospora sorghi TaxID=230839 RepID=A0ACC0WLR3_9STRA|nr:hypothetical protein PsorP6_017532 [Peronosclerospora sorghi]